MLKLNLQYFGHVIRRADSLGKTLMLGGIGMFHLENDSRGDLPDPEIEPVSSALQADSLPLSHLGSPEMS